MNQSSEPDPVAFPVNVHALAEAAAIEIKCSWDLKLSTIANHVAAAIMADRATLTAALDEAKRLAASARSLALEEAAKVVEQRDGLIPNRQEIASAIRALASQESAEDPRPGGDVHRIGEFIADYGPIPTDELAQPIPEMDQLLANSIEISRNPRPGETEQEERT